MTPICASLRSIPPPSNFNSKTPSPKKRPTKQREQKPQTPLQCPRINTGISWVKGRLTQRERERERKQEKSFVHGQESLANWTTCRNSSPFRLTHHTQQFLFQDVLPFLVFLTWLVGFVVLPPHRLLALSASNIPNNMSPGCHATFHSIGL